MATHAKRFEYSVSVEHRGSMTAEGTAPMSPEAAWTPEHLVLAALCQCSLKSLDFSARRAGTTVTGTASAAGLVTRRDEDGLFALVEVDVDLDVRIDPAPEDLKKLLYFAEKGCFVGASLRAKPNYRWTVNGTPIG